MAPKKSKQTKATAKAKTADVAPPLPDEQPPLPNEAPPLPDEAPPLPDEQPPLPDEQPPLPDEQPPLPDEQPPLPDEQPPLPDEQPPLPADAEPVTELGDGDDNDDDEEEEGDGDGEDKGKGKGKSAGGDNGNGKGKAKAQDDDKGKDGKASKTPDPGAWQAVWAPEQNAYYFWNKDTGEVTWINPLAPPPESSEAPPLPDEPAPPPTIPAASTSRPVLRPGPIPDIDPALRHLLGPEQRDGTAVNNLKYAPQDNNYSFTHLDEYNRAKRFSEHYFDVEGWEKQKAAEALKRKAEEEAGIVHPKKITKKDMDRFRAKKAEQKQRRQAWLYD